MTKHTAKPGKSEVLQYLTCSGDGQTLKAHPVPYKHISHPVGRGVRVGVHGNLYDTWQTSHDKPVW